MLASGTNGNTYPAATSGNNATGYSKSATSYAGAPFVSKNWSGIGAGVSSEAMSGTVALIGGNVDGAFTLLVGGENIGAGEPGDQSGDATTFTVSAIRRGWTAGGYSALSIAVPGTAAGHYTTAGAPLGNWLTRFCEVEHVKYGVNRRTTAVADNKACNSLKHGLLRERKPIVAFDHERPERRLCAGRPRHRAIERVGDDRHGEDGEHCPALGRPVDRDR